MINLFLKFKSFCNFTILVPTSFCNFTTSYYSVYIIMKFIKISEDNNFPKYQQIINSVEKAIANQLLKKNDKLPSINKICLEFKISRDTVLYAYEELKKIASNTSAGRSLNTRSYRERALVLWRSR